MEANLELGRGPKNSELETGGGVVETRMPPPPYRLEDNTGIWNFMLGGATNWEYGEGGKAQNLFYSALS